MLMGLGLVANLPDKDCGGGCKGAAEWLPLFFLLGCCYQLAYIYLYIVLVLTDGFKLEESDHNDESMGVVHGVAQLAYVKI